MITKKFIKYFGIFLVSLLTVYLILTLSKFLFSSYVKLNHYDDLLAKDYRGKTLPDTQYLKVFFKKINISKNQKFINNLNNFPRGYNINNKFFLEHILGKIFIIYANGSSFYYNVSDLLDSSIYKKINIKRYFKFKFYLQKNKYNKQPE